VIYELSGDGCGGERQMKVVNEKVGGWVRGGAVCGGERVRVTSPTITRVERKGASKRQY